MSKGKKSTYRYFPFGKAFIYANHGMTASELAESLSMTEDDLFDTLNDLKNSTAKKEARDLLSTLEDNKKVGSRAKAKKAVEEFKASHPEVQIEILPAPVSASPSVTSKKTIKVEEFTIVPSIPSTPAVIEESSEAQNKKSKIFNLELEIEKTELKLSELNNIQAEAVEKFAESEQLVRQYKAELQSLIDKIEKTKELYYSEKENLERAKESLIATEGRKTALEKKLADLEEKLKKATVPEIYICSNGEITCENIDIPEDIDCSSWATVIDSLPEEIGGQLRRRDAQTLIRLKAIEESSGRDDCLMMFDNEQLESAYAAYKQLF